MSPDASQPFVRLEITSQPSLLAGARALVSSIAQRCGFNEIPCGQISLAVDEALCNIIKRGYDGRGDGRIWVSVSECQEQSPGIEIVIEDDALQVDPEGIRSRDLDDIRPGGLGVHIIRQIMDEVSYARRDRQGMRLTLVKHLRPVTTVHDSESKHEQL